MIDPAARLRTRSTIQLFEFSTEQATCDSCHPAFACLRRHRSCTPLETVFLQCSEEVPMFLRRGRRQKAYLRLWNVVAGFSCIGMPVLGQLVNTNPIPWVCHFFEHGNPEDSDPIHILSVLTQQRTIFCLSRDPHPHASRGETMLGARHELQTPHPAAAGSTASTVLGWLASAAPMDWTG